MFNEITTEAETYDTDLAFTLSQEDIVEKEGPGTEFAFHLSQTDLMFL